MAEFRIAEFSRIHLFLNSAIQNSAIQNSVNYGMVKIGTQSPYFAYNSAQTVIKLQSCSGNDYLYLLWFSLRCFYHRTSWLSGTIKIMWRNLNVRPIQDMSILNWNTFFRILSSLAFFTGMVSNADQVLLLFYLEDQLAFNQHYVSLMFLIISIFRIIVQVLVMKHLNDCVGKKLVIAISFCCGSTVNFLYGIATHKICSSRPFRSSRPIMSKIVNKGASRVHYIVLRYVWTCERFCCFVVVVVVLWRDVHPFYCSLFSSPTINDTGLNSYWY